MDKKVLIGVGVATAAVMAGGVAAATYLMLKDERESAGHVSSGPVTIHVKIKTEFSSLVIGRGGENIREIQRRTNTRIYFKDELETATHRVLAVNGRGDEAQLAEILIHQTIANRPKLETLVLTVPGRCVGRIIGHGGETIRSIQNASRCKVEIEKMSGDFPRKITLKGTGEQIGLAKDMIDDKVMLANESPQKKGHLDVFRQKRPSLLYITSENDTDSDGAIDPKTDLKNHYQTIWPEKSVDPSNSNFIEVYVSSITNPWDFHVQKVGPESVKLDKLSQDMSGFYQSLPNRERNVLSKVAVDDVVASQFSVDRNWYRSRVLEIFADEYDEAGTEVEVEFVDFGFCEKKLKSEVFQLEPQFLKLKFQAIKCSLASVKPVESLDTWSEEAVDEFERLSYAFQWKAILAKLKGFRLTDGSRKVPQIELVDAKGDSDVVVAEVLIAEGLALSSEKDT